MALCSECNLHTKNYTYVNQRIQCRRCWELGNMPQYLRVQTLLPKGEEE